MVAKVEALASSPEMSPYPHDEALEAEIARLPALGLGELRARWRKLYGAPAPKFFRRELLMRAVAYQMRVKVYGGLSPATKRRLREIVEAVRNGNGDDLFSAPRIKPGTQLLRVWQDETHRVTALPEGFEWKGAKYGSLSAIAREITGTNWNGYAFFGLKRRSRKKPPPATPEPDHA
jgi:Protein of unknown function (DUF2924)